MNIVLIVLVMIHVLIVTIMGRTPVYHCYRPLLVIFVIGNLPIIIVMGYLPVSTIVGYMPIITVVGCMPIITVAGYIYLSSPSWAIHFFSTMASYRPVLTITSCCHAISVSGCVLVTICLVFCCIDCLSACQAALG